jgi:hypothetical protein
VRLAVWVSDAKNERRIMLEILGGIVVYMMTLFVWTSEL